MQLPELVEKGGEWKFRACGGREGTQRRRREHAMAWAKGILHGGASGGGQSDAIAQDEGVIAGDPLPGELRASCVHAARRPRAPHLLACTVGT